MPIAHYTISHKTTRRVLAFVSLEKKTTLTDAAAWEAFRTELVGDTELVLPTFGTHKDLKMPVEQLAVDEVEADAATARRLYENPYAFQIVTSATSEPGDGSKKELSTPGNTATPALVAPHKLVVTLANIPAETPVCVLLEGEAPQSLPITVPNVTATFTVATTLVATNSYLVVVLAAGAPVFSGLVTST